MDIDWGSLGLVFVVALGAAVVLTVLFAYGVRGLAGREVARERGGSGVVQLTGSIVCFAVCAAVVGYGIYLIVA
ncbi:hypothetical protein [Amycolatopsis sp. FDAARGOS 1241]|uniref:hypothetical protein n=1 Tax=Amycolatopsis sp. FDAARGOS 1241 TaxID=2778070 RepID=UPI00194DED6C|nr:hypothetical protein [Amycolatopsis sp. FDAARGOS 1241]QRP44911.1 hypothetical protein I6J71_37770 [Amycolatopsis sp. FDAARGOS 1241]